MFHGVIQKITLAQFFLRHGVFEIRGNHLSHFRYCRLFMNETWTWLKWPWTVSGVFRNVKMAARCTLKQKYFCVRPGLLPFSYENFFHLQKGGTGQLYALVNSRLNSLRVTLNNRTPIRQ